MPNRETVDFVVRKFRSRHAALEASFEALKVRLVSEDRPSKRVAALATKQVVADLQSNLPPQDQPQWLTALLSELDIFVAQFDQGLPADRLLQALFSIGPQMKNHKWGFENAEDTVGIDFAGIAAEAMAASKLPTLLDVLIKQIEAIIEAGLIDSIKVERDLQTLMATLRKTKKDDTLSATGGIKLARTFCNNVLVAVGEKTPGLNIMVAAVTKTLDQCEEEVTLIKNAIGRRVDSVFKSDALRMELEDFIPRHSLPSPTPAPKPDDA